MTDQMKTLTSQVGAETARELDAAGNMQTMMMMQMQMQMCKMNQRMMEMVEESDRKRRRERSPSPPPPSRRAPCELVLDLHNPVLSAQDLADFEEWRCKRARKRASQNASQGSDVQSGDGV